MCKFINRLLIALLIVMCIPELSLAQSETLSGKVVDDMGEVLPGAYVEMFVSSDVSDSYITVITDSLGEFSVSPDKDIRLIRVLSFGYDEARINAPFSFPLKIVLNAKSFDLEEIVVTGKIPAKITADGIKFTPTKLQKNLPSISNYLSQLPFVEKVGNTFCVAGKGTAVFYINNRRVVDSGELKELKMDNIKAVEVIPNPGVFYDSDVKAVIKIQTKKKNLGFGIDLTSAVIHSELTENWDRAIFSYNTPVVSVKSSLFYDYSPSRAHIDIGQEMRSDHKSNVRYNTVEKQLFRNIKFRNSLVYEPNKYNSMGASLSYAHAKWNTDVCNGLNFTDPSSNISFEQDSHSKSPSHKWSGNIFYHYSKDKINLLFNTDLYRGVGSDDMVSHSSDHNIDSDIDTRTDDNNFLCYFQAAGSYDISNNFKFQLGADYAHTYVNQAYKLDQEHSNLKPFDIKTYQQRYAGYASLNYRLNPISLSVGLRHEALTINRDEGNNTGRKKLFSTSKLYPSASVSISKRPFQSQFSYALKTEYPAYSQLRAGMNYSSPYLYEGGNPDLYPETRHELSWLSMYRSTSLMFNYTMVEDEIMQVPILYTDNILLYKPENTANNKYLSLSLAQNIKWSRALQTSLRMGYSHQWLDIPNYAKNSGDGYMFKANNTISVNNNIQFYLDAAYRSSCDSGLFYIPHSWNMDFLVNFSLLSNKLNVFLECADIFSTLHGKRVSNCRNTTIDYDRDFQTRRFSIYLTYNISSIIKGKRYKGNRTNSEIQRL